jgi:hypothetical protein
MHLIEAEGGVLGRYIGYYEPYASSHDELDRDNAVQEETRLAARSLLTTMASVRNGSHPALHRTDGPRPK